MSPRPADTRRLVGRYRLDSELGRGAMGTVWSAYDEVLHRPVAVKEVRLSLVPVSERAIVRERTLREARATAMLSHPNVVTLYDVVEVDSEPYVVMELLPSRSLAAYIGERGTLSHAETAEIGSAVASALMTAHRAGITHRDVKPGNVLIGTDGQIKLTDFGIARNAAESSMTQTGTVLGSPPYIAPEVAMGRAVGPPADLWGLGATLFACLEGRPPYDAGDPVSTVSAVVHGDIPRPSGQGPVADVIRGLMVKDPGLRMPLPAVRRRLRPLMADPEGPMLSAPPSPATTEFRLPQTPPASTDDPRSGLIPVRGRSGTLVEGADPSGERPPQPGPAPRRPSPTPPAPRTAPFAGPLRDTPAAPPADEPASDAAVDAVAAPAEAPSTGTSEDADDGAAGAAAAGAAAAGAVAAGASAGDASSGGDAASSSGTDDPDGDGPGADDDGTTDGPDDAAAADGDAEDDVPDTAVSTDEQPDDASAKQSSDGPAANDEHRSATDAKAQVAGAQVAEVSASEAAEGTGKASAAAPSGPGDAGKRSGVTPTTGEQSTGEQSTATAPDADGSPDAGNDEADDGDAGSGGAAAVVAGGAAALAAGGAAAVAANRATSDTTAPEDSAPEPDDGVASTAGGIAGNGSDDTPDEDSSETAAKSESGPKSESGAKKQTSTGGSTGSTASGTGAATPAAATDAEDDDGRTGDDRRTGDDTPVTPTATPSTATPRTTTPSSGTPRTTTPSSGTPRPGTPPSGTPRTPTPSSGTPRTSTPSSGNPRTPTPSSGNAAVPEPSAAETTMVTPRVPEGARPAPRPAGPSAPGPWSQPYQRPPRAPMAAPRRPGSPQALAPDPGPLPFAPSRQAPATPSRGWRVGVVALVVALALAGLIGGYAAVRMIGGQPPFSVSLAPDGPVVDGERMVAHSDDNARYSGTGMGFTALVPSSWQQFRLQETTGDIVVRYVSDDATRELRIDRLVRFYPAQRTAAYVALLGDPSRLGADAVRVEPLTVVAPPRAGAEEPVQQTVYRARSGPTDDRTTWTRLIPSGTDLWVVRMTVPSTAPGGAPEQFATVADSFTPPV
ncbi:serine/threonine protein kinase [Actinomycetospora sp.]|uniref:serine/threonine protein kinase n=1 Tax=Actinomycetospora sp. TaxID=1872135 RepID=UPI002F3F69B3